MTERESMWIFLSVMNTDARILARLHSWCLDVWRNSLQFTLSTRICAWTSVFAFQFVSIRISSGQYIWPSRRESLKDEQVYHLIGLRYCRVKRQCCFDLMWGGGSSHLGPEDCSRSSQRTRRGPQTSLLFSAFIAVYWLAENLHQSFWLFRDVNGRRPPLQDFPLRNNFSFSDPCSLLNCDPGAHWDTLASDSHCSFLWVCG